MSKYKSILKPAMKCSNMALLGITIFFSGSSSVFGQEEASNFTVLSAAQDSTGSVYCTDSTINGDVGFSGAGTSLLQNGCPIEQEVIPMVSNQVLVDFDSIHTDLTTAVCENTLTGNLDGITLTPGVYCFDTEAELTGVLTLNGPAEGNWIFKVGALGMSTLKATNFAVVMAGGAQNCNVWWVADAAILTSSQYKGSLVTSGTITLTGGSLHGRAMTKTSLILTGVTVTACGS